jgi:predicted nucleic acid-binding protein
MPAYYVETAAMLKRYRREPGSDVVRELFADRQAGEQFATSYFTALEVRAVIERMLRGRLLRPSQYRRLMLRVVTDFAIGDFRLLPLDDTLIDEALRLLPDHPLRAPDTLHLASALRVQRAAGTAGLYLVTGDRELAEAARRYPMQVIDPEDGGARRQLSAIREMS